VGGVIILISAAVAIAIVMAIVMAKAMTMTIAANVVQDILFVFGTVTLGNVNGLGDASIPQYSRDGPRTLLIALKDLGAILPVPGEGVAIEPVMVKVGRRLDAFKVLLLHVVDAGVGGGIEPLAHHVVHVAASIPVALVAVVGAEDDEEGDGRDEDADAVRVVDVAVVAGVVVCFQQVVHDHRQGGGCEGAVQGRPVHSEYELEA
jgi:hypothetical protein